MLILLAAFILGAEHLLACKFYRRDKTAEPTQAASLAGFGASEHAGDEKSTTQPTDHAASSAWPTRKQAPPPDYRAAAARHEPPVVREPPRATPPRI
ncbi:MAG: hypothetical protein QM811_31095 [Pirellulales bacterium]